MKKILILTVLILGMGMPAEEFEWKDPTFGGLRPIPELSAGQKKVMELLTQEVEVLHKDLEKRLNFISQKNEIVDGKFVKMSPAREQFDFPITTIYLTNHWVVVHVAGGGDSYTISNIEFNTRKSNIKKNTPQPNTRIMKMSNDPTSKDWSKFKVSMKKIQVHGTSFQEVGLEDVYNPIQRVRLAKIYKTKLLELTNAIDQQIANVGFQSTADIRFIKNEMNTGGGYEDF